nr:MAG TPA: hypothetical protein [Caudoviricetes sp.]
MFFFYYILNYILVQVYNLHKYTCTRLYILSIDILTQVCYYKIARRKIKIRRKR